MTRLVIASSVFQAQVSDLLPVNHGKRSQLIHSLIKAHGLLSCFDYVIGDCSCSVGDLLQFHSRSYVECILDEKLNQVLPYDEIEPHCPLLIDEDSPDNLEPRRGQFRNRMELFEHFLSYTGEKTNSSLHVGCKRTAEQANIDLPDILNDSVGKQQYNLVGDCPIFSFLPMYLRVTTGATLRVADFLGNHNDMAATNDRDRCIAINWDGGRHHAMKSRASGFCYINDIVLLIEALRKRGTKRISYVDFDLHHGDGVEAAFRYSDRVQTISVHMYEPGFFPCTGSLQSSMQEGRKSINLPVKSGFDDKSLKYLTKNLIIKHIKKFSPEVLIIQCGGDGLLGDKYNAWQLSIRGLAQSIVSIIDEMPDCEIVLLGGGGYNDLLMSRFYTYLTWLICNKYSSLNVPPLGVWDELSSDSDEYTLLIPEHEHRELYAEEQYKFWVNGHRDGDTMRPLYNHNTSQYLDEIVTFYEKQ